MDRIDTSPGRSCMSYGFDVAPLINSIAKIGLMNPPLLLLKGEGKGGEGEFEVIAGFRRVSALKKLSLKSIPGRILPFETSSLDCVLINLYDNLCTRDFNTIEKGMILRRLLDLIPHEDVLNIYMPILHLPSHPATLELYVGIEKVFEPLAKTLLATERLSIKTAKLLLDMNNQDREMFCTYYSAIGFSKNQQAQFVDLISDLSHMENVPMAQMLSARELKDIRDSDQMNNPQKAKALMTLLRKKRSPRLMKANRRFSQWVKKLALPGGVHITPPAFFEDTRYRLDMTFENGNDLMDKLRVLQKKKELATFEDPWDKSA